MRSVKLAYYVWVLALCGFCNAGSLAQTSQREAAISAYGKQTSKYITIMHYTAITVANKAIDLSHHHGLIYQKSWQAGVLSQLDSLIAASKSFQSIRPVPHGFEKVNRDFAGLGRKMERAGLMYKHGVKSGNPSLVYTAFGSMKEVDDTLVALSKMRSQ